MTDYTWGEYEAFVRAEGQEILRCLDRDGHGRVANRYFHADAQRGS